MNYTGLTPNTSYLFVLSSGDNTAISSVYGCVQRFTTDGSGSKVIPFTYNQRAVVGYINSFTIIPQVYKDDISIFVPDVGSFIPGTSSYPTPLTDHLAAYENYIQKTSGDTFSLQLNGNYRNEFGAIELKNIGTAFALNVNGFLLTANNSYAHTAEIIYIDSSGVGHITETITNFDLLEYSDPFRVVDYASCRFGLTINSILLEQQSHGLYKFKLVIKETNNSAVIFVHLYDLYTSNCIMENNDIKFLSTSPLLIKS